MWGRMSRTSDVGSDMVDRKSGSVGRRGTNADAGMGTRMVGDVGDVVVGRERRDTSETVWGGKGNERDGVTCCPTSAVGEGGTSDG